MCCVGQDAEPAGEERREGHQEQQDPVARQHEDQRQRGMAEQQHACPAHHLREPLGVRFREQDPLPLRSQNHLAAAAEALPEQVREHQHQRLRMEGKSVDPGVPLEVERQHHFQVEIVVSGVLVMLGVAAAELDMVEPGKKAVDAKKELVQPAALEHALVRQLVAAGTAAEEAVERAVQVDRCHHPGPCQVVERPEGYCAGGDRESEHAEIVQ